MENGEQEMGRARACMGNGEQEMGKARACMENCEQKMGNPRACMENCEEKMGENDGTVWGGHGNSWSLVRSYGEIWGFLGIIASE